MQLQHGVTAELQPIYCNEAVSLWLEIYQERSHKQDKCVVVKFSWNEQTRQVGLFCDTLVTMNL